VGKFQHTTKYKFKAMVVIQEKIHSSENSNNQPWRIHVFRKLSFPLSSPELNKFPIPNIKAQRDREKTNLEDI
jgi:hypothetical protein